MTPQDDRRWSKNHAWPDRAIAEIAGRQATMVGHGQLRALGIPGSTIASALARGRLHPVHHGVHSLVPAAARPALAAEHAALLACGPRGLISHETAARLHAIRLPARPGGVHVTVVGSRRGRRQRGLHAHTTGALAADERTRLVGLPVTSLARTVLDLAPGRSERAVEQLVVQALRHTSRAKLLAVLDRAAGHAGTRALRLALDPARPSSDTWSTAEERLLTLLRRAGVPPPEVNVAVGRYVPDLLWREHRVIVEYDSRDHHSGEGARLSDARRHNDLTSWGFTVLHVTHRDLRAPERMLVWVVAALTHNGWSPAANA